MKTNRKFNFKDVDMLLASKTIVQSLTDNLADLSAVRSNWTEDYVNGLNAKIDDVIENYLGLDKKKELREATIRLSAIQSPARTDLSFFKTQLEVDYNGDIAKKDDILKELGFAKNLRATQLGNQESLIQLLYSFKRNMTDELKEEIVEKGISIALIDRITEYADQLKEAEVSQETLKESTKSISAEAVKVLNEIYEEIVGICKIASKFYKFDSLKKGQFTFTRIASNMSTPRSMSQDHYDAA
jgi:hypothetical protein